VKRRPSRKAQVVDENVHYYETARRLRFYVWTTEAHGPRHCIEFKVPASMLRTSLARMSLPKRRKVVR
jgi:hypothetical protein